MVGASYFAIDAAQFPLNADVLLVARGGAVESVLAPRQIHGPFQNSLRAWIHHGGGWVHCRASTGRDGRRERRP